VGPAGEHLVYALPLRSRFRSVTVREGMLWQGEAGWGDFCPFWDYDAAESLPWWRAAMEAAEHGWPAPVRDAVPVNCTVPAVDPATAHAIAAAPHGCSTAKVKVAERGQTLSDDVARVEAVRDALGADGRLRVDANGAWDVDTAVTALRALDRAAGGLQYAEQPCATVDELAAVRRRVDVPIAADESIRRADDPYLVAARGAADVAVLKVAPLGGVAACLEIAGRIGLPVVVSSALESSVGLAAGVALAAALPDLPYACGLGTASMFDHDVTSTPLVAVAGAVPVGPLVPDSAAMAAASADPTTVRRWSDRLAEVSLLDRPRQDRSP